MLPAQPQHKRQHPHADIERFAANRASIYISVMEFYSLNSRSLTKNAGSFSCDAGFAAAYSQRCRHLQPTQRRATANIESSYNQTRDFYLVAGQPNERVICLCGLLS